jgi:transposase
MVTVDKIALIRRAYFGDGKTIKEIVRELAVSRKVVRKVVRSGATEFVYRRQVQPRPQLGAFAGRLEALLSEDAARPRRDRLTLRRIADLLRREGYAGGYDAVRRHARQWQRAHQPASGGQACVPLVFPPGDAYQFDWSHEHVVLGGMTALVKVAHVRLCHSRAFYLRAYPRETQEMVFDAHARAFAFFGGACRRGIYDNMSTAVDAVFLGKERAFNRRFLQLCSHYLVEPVACTPAAGWEKGQVENQVGFARDNLFKPRPRAACLEELNAWLEAECRRWMAQHRHPELRERTLAEVLEGERPGLVALAGAPFEGFREVEAVASATCLVTFDRNRYSVAAAAARRPVQVRAYADRVVVRHDGQVVAEHARQFGRDRTVFDPWHYLPVLLRKPGALRNGAPFQDWPLPPALERLRRALGRGDQADRAFVAVLAAVPREGIDAVASACAEALAAHAASADVVLNILARRREPPRPGAIAVPPALALAVPPTADCARYDRLLRPSSVTTSDAETERAAA